jgi:hypothetical protein
MEDKREVAPMEEEEEDDDDDDDDDEGDEDEDDDEEEEEEAMVGKDRAAPAGKPAPQSVTKQQKTPATATPGTNAGSAAKRSPIASPRGGACCFHAWLVCTRV